MKLTEKRADLLLLMVVSFWGASFYLIDVASADLSPFNLNAFRFLIAFFVCAVIFNKKLGKISRSAIIWSLFLGAVLAVMYACLTFGIKYTTLTNSAFLCQTSVIITPFLSSRINKTKVTAKTYISAFLCLVGVALLTLGGQAFVSFEHITGDVLCILCGVLISFHIVFTEKAVSKENADTLQISVLQLGVTGVLCLTLSVIFEFPHFPATSISWFAALFLAVLCTGFAIVIQTFAQTRTSASHVGIIFSLEPVIAGFVAYFFAGEVMSAQGYLGALIMLIGVFLMETDFFEKRKPETEIRDSVFRNIDRK